MYFYNRIIILTWKSIKINQNRKFGQIALALNESRSDRQTKKKQQKQQ